MTTKTNETASTQIAKKEKTAGELFTEMVVKEFTSTGENLALTNFQKRLCQNYFVTLDAVLKTAEEKRLKKDEKYRDRIAITWQTVNMELLARNVVSAARIGFDPAQKNHINMIPYKNNTTNKYDIVLMEGYRGMELKATKYGLDVPDSVTTELVYSTDNFKPIKKDLKNQVEGYIFEITQPFERGDIVGGFYYFSYTEKPQRNTLVFYTVDEILKRKPEYASVEFWGGEKDNWVTDEATSKRKKEGKVQVEGWYKEMLWKTLRRAAYGNITIDSQKIDDDYLVISTNERKSVDDIADEKVKANANKENLTFDEAELVNEDTGEVTNQVENQPTSQPTQQSSMPGF